MSILQQLRLLNNAKEKGPVLHSLYFESSQKKLVRIGSVLNELIPFLDPKYFIPQQNGSFLLKSSSATRREITLELEENIFEKWRKMNGKFKCLDGWRSERYSVFDDEGDIIFDVERSASGLIGMRTYGCHLNGYVRSSDNQILVWVATRSLTKQTHPGMLDNMAAGGLGAGYSAYDTMVKECGEEAGIPKYLAEKVKPVGCVSFYEIRKESFENEPGLDYCFDLELPLDFAPTPQDGEVANFQLCSLSEIEKQMQDGLWKPESLVVMVDFMVRHGYFVTDLSDYLDICLELRQSFPEFPSRSLKV